MIQTYKKGKDQSVIVQATFWGARRSDLHIIDRDFKSKKMGYSISSYLEVLEQNIPRIFKPGLTFMQDNAPIHCAYKVRNWFIENGIPLLDQPPYSPDLNPIKHLWFRLKNYIYIHHLEILDILGEEAAKEALARALTKAWDAIS